MTHSFLSEVEVAGMKLPLSFFYVMNSKYSQGVVLGYSVFYEHEAISLREHK